MLTFDSKIAYKIPEESRDKYFKISDTLIAATSRKDPASIIDAYNDPIVIFNLENIPAKIVSWLKISMFLIGAKNITEQLQN